MMDKIHERNTVREHSVIISTPVQADRRHNVLDLSLRPSVCSFVRLIPSSELYISKIN